MKLDSSKVAEIVSKPDELLKSLVEETRMLSQSIDFADLEERGVISNEEIAAVAGARPRKFRVVSTSVRQSRGKQNIHWTLSMEYVRWPGGAARYPVSCGRTFTPTPVFMRLWRRK